MNKYAVKHKHKMIFFVFIEKKNTKKKTYETYVQFTKLTCTCSCLILYAISPA